MDREGAVTHTKGWSKTDNQGEWAVQTRPSAAVDLPWVRKLGKKPTASLGPGLAVRKNAAFDKLRTDCRGYQRGSDC